MGHYFTFFFLSFFSFFWQQTHWVTGNNVNSKQKIRFPCKLQLMKQRHYLTAKEPEQRVAHIPPMVAPGPACQHVWTNIKSSSTAHKKCQPVTVMSYYGNSQIKWHGKLNAVNYNLVMLNTKICKPCFGVTSQLCPVLSLANQCFVSCHIF